MKFKTRRIAKIHSEIGLIEIEGGLPHSLSNMDTILNINIANCPERGAILIGRGNNQEIVDFHILEGKLNLMRGRSMGGAKYHERGATMDIIEQVTAEEVQAVMLSEYLTQTLKPKK